MFADYDVDGATSGAQLVRWLRHLGHDPLTYVPDVSRRVTAFCRAFCQSEGGRAGLVIHGSIARGSFHDALESVGGDGPCLWLVIDHHLLPKTVAPPPAAAPGSTPTSPATNTSGL